MTALFVRPRRRSGSPIPRRPRRAGCIAELKEADVIKLPPLPTMAGFKAWRSNVHDQVTAASGRGDRVFRWMLDVEEPIVTKEALAHPGHKYLSLDLKLKAAASAIATKEISRQILQASEDEARAKRTLNLPVQSAPLLYLYDVVLSM